MLCFCFAGNGKIDFQEFVQLMEKMTNPVEDDKAALDAFRVFDPDGKGYIQSKAIREILQRHLDQVPQSEIFELVRVSDLEDDRRVQFEGVPLFLLCL